MCQCGLADAEADFQGEYDHAVGRRQTTASRDVLSGSCSSVFARALQMLLVGDGRLGIGLESRVVQGLGGGGGVSEWVNGMAGRRLVTLAS